LAITNMKAALDPKGRPTAWLQRSVFPLITSIFVVDAAYGDPGHLQQGWTDIGFLQLTRRRRSTSDNRGERRRPLLARADWTLPSARCDAGSPDYVLARAEHYCVYPITVFTARGPGR